MPVIASAKSRQQPSVETSAPASSLKRSLNLPLLVLYGLGTTIGAGIYVLVGAAAGKAGIYAPVAFIIAAISVAPTAACYAELSGRFPVSAGEAAFVNAGFKSLIMSRLVGWLVILSGVVASATIAIGCAGYIRTFIDLPLPLTILTVIMAMGLVATWGILESVLFAAVLTLIEAGGLLMLIYLGISSDFVTPHRLLDVIPTSVDVPVSMGIASAGILAVFAFIGFEDMVNVAEETKKPRLTMPVAIFLTLLITTVLYSMVAVVAVLTVSPADLAVSEAPLSMVYQQLTGGSPILLSAIAIFATANTILVQFIMVSRVVYGMAKRGTMPAVFGRVSETTNTPVVATFAVVAVSTVLALAFPLEKLAEVTSQAIMVIWILTNTALLLIKLRKEPADDEVFIVPVWVPVLGLVFSITLVGLSITG